MLVLISILFKIHLTHNVFINFMDMVNNLDEMQLTLSMVYAPCKRCMALAMKKVLVGMHIIHHVPLKTLAMLSKCTLPIQFLLKPWLW